jgi:peptidoglycan/LPS O-acetylase OafA/YrhL
VEDRGHVAGLDGLRAIAALSVMLFHMHVPWASLGWGGVTLFFVISGFLITRILLASREAPNYYSSFYLRRSLRILPIYYLYLFFAIALSCASGAPPNAGTTAFYLVYLQSIALVVWGAEGGWHGAPSDTLHTWSLAVEEQFYAVWPFVVRTLSPRALGVLLGALVVGAPLYRAVIVNVGNVYCVTAVIATHLDALALGAGLALWVRAGATRKQVTIAGAGAALVGGAALAALIARSGLLIWGTPDGWLKIPGNHLVYSAFAVASLGLVALAVAGTPGYVRVLETRPFTFLGKRSYGLYLYHLCAFRLLDEGLIKLNEHWTWVIPAARQPSGYWLVIGLAIALVAGIAALSWRLVEQPFLRLKDRYAARPR